MIVDEVEDLDSRSVSKGPVGGVGLPELVGQLRREAGERGARPLVRLGRDQAVAREDPPDRGDRGELLQAVREVIGDGLGAGVVAGRGKLTPHLEDQGLGLRPDLMRTGMWPPRAWLERGVPALAVARHELIDPAAREVVRPGELARTASFECDRIHHVPSQTHRGTPSPAWVSTMS